MGYIATNGENRTFYGGIKFDSARIEKLTERAGPLFTRFRAELLAFADFLEANKEKEV